MPVERRGWVIAFEIGSTGNGRNPIFNGRRQPSCGGTSRMTRECQVRICERLGVKFPGPTRLVSRVTPVHTAVRNCTRDEGRPFLRQDKSRKGERECDLKPFIAIQRVQLPPGKGEPASRKRALQGWR